MCGTGVPPVSAVCRGKMPVPPEVRRRAVSALQSASVVSHGLPKSTSRRIIVGWWGVFFFTNGGKRR